MDNSFDCKAPLFVRGINEFNRQDFYECHETLEEYWNTLPVDLPERQLVQGIIQIAVGFYHLKRENVKGALKLFARGHARLVPFANPFTNCVANLDVGPCSAAVAANIALLEAGSAFDDARLTVPVIGQILLL